MDRREFLKLCMTMAAGFTLFGCRSGGLTDKLSGPTLKDFEDEVRRAMGQMKPGFRLVKVPMPGKMKSLPADRENRFGIAIDLDACDGCGKCILACNQENNVPLVSESLAKQGRFMHWIELRDGIPTMCFHCSDAPCEKVCPTGAANHTPDGLSAMMYKRCAGSRFCGANCPVQARKFNYEDARSLGHAKQFNPQVPLRDKGVMEKCSLCIQRLQNDRMNFKANAGLASMTGAKSGPAGGTMGGTMSGKNSWRGKGLQTACAIACPKHAIIFGNWLDESSDLVKEAKVRNLYAPEGIAKLDPSVVYMRGRR